MSDRLQEIRARLDAASRYPWTNDDGWIVCGGTTRYYVTGHTTLEGDADLIAHAPADIAWLLDEVEKWRERAERQNPVIEVRGDDGSVWVRIDGIKAPRIGGAA